jgi:hypothetical protein
MPSILASELITNSETRSSLSRLLHRPLSWVVGQLELDIAGLPLPLPLSNQLSNSHAQRTRKDSPNALIIPHVHDDIYQELCITLHE